MGIQIVLEDERGAKLASIEDSTNILHGLLPARDNAAYRLLNCVDWYGDTTFNRFQIPEVRRELSQLAKSSRCASEIKLIQQFDELAAKAESEPHLYLKLYGD